MASATGLHTYESTSSDALATVSACVHDPEVLYGTSSTISFVERVFLITGETGNFGEQSRNSAEVKHEMHSVEKADRQARQLSGLEILPIRRISDSYVNNFWDVTHSIFPILHRPTFTRFYNQLWEPTNVTETPGATPDPIILATLNIVLAIGCRLTKSVHRGTLASLSDQFYQRARGIVPIDALDVASLPAVQLLLLTAVYLQSTTYASRCWNVVGLAMRVAQSLGLHLNRSTSGTSNQLVREMRRRIWYTLICTTFGRPTMLPDSSSVPLPLIVDDEYLLEDGEGTQPITLQCRIGSFVYTIQLLDILNEVLHSFYAEDDQAQTRTDGKYEERSMPDLYEMLRLDSKLDRFLEALPSNLKLQSLLMSSDAPTGNCLLQARVLYCRFLYTRLLLLRPVILSLARSASRKEPHSAIPDQNSLGRELAKRMAQDKDSVYRCSAWWTIYFTFGAATVVLASQLCSPQDVTGTLADDSLSLAMEIFNHYTPEVESATQANQVLEGLRKRLTNGEKKGADVSHQEVQPTQRPNESLHHDSEPVYYPGASSGEYYGQPRTPDPLSEDWFSRQALNFDFQDYI
ncbi:hypothetical protein ACEPPN_019184 [Leptodophora sp. 'Broadleaf-Isolate-01']